MRVLTLTDALGLTEIPANGIAWHDAVINEGLPYRSAKALSKELGLKESELLAFLGLNAELAKQRKTLGFLGSGESDVAYRLARVLVRAINLKGSKAEGVEWLKAENDKLRDRRPLDLCRSTIGHEYVNALLDRIAPLPAEEAVHPEAPDYVEELAQEPVDVMQAAEELPD